MTRMLILALDIAGSSATNLNQQWTLCSISAEFRLGRNATVWTRFKASRCLLHNIEQNNNKLNDWNKNEKR